MKMWIETERTPYVNKTYLEQFKDSILSTDLSNSYRDSISLAPYTNSIFCLNMKNIILANQILANQKKKKKFFCSVPRHFNYSEKLTAEQKLRGLNLQTKCFSLEEGFKFTGAKLSTIPFRPMCYDNNSATSTFAFLAWEANSGAWRVNLYPKLKLVTVPTFSSKQISSLEVSIVPAHQ